MGSSSFLTSSGFFLFIICPCSSLCHCASFLSFCGFGWTIGTGHRWRQNSGETISSHGEKFSQGQSVKQQPESGGGSPQDGLAVRVRWISIFGAALIVTVGADLGGTALDQLFSQYLL